MWISAGEALKRLGSKPQSLYANVSRGRIRARPDPTDARKSQYLSEDVERLAERARGRRSSEVVAKQAVNWGEPVLSTSVSTVVAGRLVYRGRDVAELARQSSFEAVAALLLEAEVDLTEPSTLPGNSGLSELLVTLARRLGSEAPAAQFSGVRLRAEAAHLLAICATTLAGTGDESIARRLAGRWKCPEAETAISRALVLLADHELNPSTFAARVTVSTGAPLSAGLLAGLGALMGHKHGTATRYVTALAEDFDASADIEVQLQDWLGEGRAIPGFGHQLYPRGDMRACALLDAFEVSPLYRDLRLGGEKLTGEGANIDFALAALTHAFGLPREAPFTLFAVARSAGWLAHMVEQLESGQMIRPRARYVRRERLHEQEASG